MLNNHLGLKPGILESKYPTLKHGVIFILLDWMTQLTCPLGQGQNHHKIKRGFNPINNWGE